MGIVALGGPPPKRLSNRLSYHPMARSNYLMERELNRRFFGSVCGNALCVIKDCALLFVIDEGLPMIAVGLDHKL